MFGLKNNEEMEFERHLTGVSGYVTNMKRVEPGYVNDNISEFKDLAEKAKKYPNNDQVRLYIEFLGKEIAIVLDRQKKPIRSTEEESFYRHIVGINSYIRETKARDKGYIFDNIIEVDGLLANMEKLGTKDKDIVAIMTIITNDIKIVISQVYGKEKAEEYQTRLNILFGLEEEKNIQK